MKHAPNPLPALAGGLETTRRDGPVNRAVVAALAPTLAAIVALVGPLPSEAESREPVTIDAIGALAGNITPGDEPGFPITISRSGHYRLGGDLRVPADTSGIVITAPDVTLDLAGHSVSGPVTCVQQPSTRTVECDAPNRFSAVVGISSVGSAGSVIRNGTVQGFAGLGVHYGEGTVLDNLQVRSNAGVGIAGMGYATSGVVRAVLVKHNGGPGIVCEQMRIERSTFAANGGTGVDCRGTWFVNSVARHNGGYGVAEGGKYGLKSFGNKLGDEVGVAMDRMPTDVKASR